MIGEYLTVKDTAKRWGLAIRTVQILCAGGKVDGAIKFSNVWAIPADAPKPTDSRVTTGEYRDWRKKHGKVGEKSS